jgi:hypothetical protein
MIVRLAALVSLLATPPASAPAKLQKSALEADPRGWTDILPDPKLTGWARVSPVSTAGVKSAVDPLLKVWTVKDGVLVCRGDMPSPRAPSKGGSHEMLRYEKELGDFIFHVEWRFIDLRRPGWNAGVYARVNQEATVWHQAQVGSASGGYWFGDTPDATGKIVRRKLDPVEQRVKPAGEWNTYEITSRGDRLILWVNGAVVSEMAGLKVRRGHIGFEAELHHIEFRNLKLKALGK